MSTAEIVNLGLVTSLIGVGVTFLVLTMLMFVMKGMKLLHKED